MRTYIISKRAIVRICAMLLIAGIVSVNFSFNAFASPGSGGEVTEIPTAGGQAAAAEAPLSIVPGGTRYGYQWLSNPANVGASNVSKLTYIYKELVKLADEIYAYTGDFTLDEWGEDYILREIDISNLALAVDIDPAKGKIVTDGPKTRISDNLIELTVDSFLNDNPQYYMLDWYFSTYTNSIGSKSGTISSVTLTVCKDYISYAVRKDNQERIEAKYREYEALTSTVQSTYDKVRLVHDKMLAERDYSYINVNGNYEPDTNAYAHNILGVMDIRTKGPVCDSYAKAFAYILHRLDVGNVIFVTGTTNSEDSELGYERHAWNLVEIDGQYYTVDITWDDYEDLNPGSEYFYDADNTKNLVRYYCFLVGIANDDYVNDGGYKPDVPFPSGDIDAVSLLYGLPANMSQSDYVPPDNFKYLTDSGKIGEYTAATADDVNYAVTYSSILYIDDTESRLGNPVYIEKPDAYYINEGPFEYESVEDIELYIWDFNREGEYIDDKFPGKPVKLIQGVDYTAVPEAEPFGGFTRVWLYGTGDFRGVTFVLVRNV